MTLVSAEEMRAALAPALRAMQLGDTLAEALGLARKALPWVSVKALVPLEQQRGALWRAILAAVFPAAGATTECVEGVLGGFAASLAEFGVGEERLVRGAMEQLAVRGSLKAATLTLRRPGAAFGLWRALTCLMPGRGHTRSNMLKALLHDAATVVFKAKGLPDAKLLVRMHGRRIHPGELLVEASEALARGQAVKTIGCLAEYVTVALAVPKKLEAGDSDVSPSCEPLPPENAVWAIEVAAALGALGCVPPPVRVAAAAALAKENEISSRRVAFVLGNGALQALAPLTGFRSPAALAADVAASGTDNRLNRALERLADAIIVTSKQLQTLKSGEGSAAAEASMLRCRLTLVAATLAASVTIDQSSPKPVISGHCAERLALSTVEASLIPQLEHGVNSFPIGDATVARNPAKLMEPLRHLAAMSGTYLIQVSGPDAKAVEFDEFPGKGPLVQVAVARLKTTLGGLSSRGESAVASALQSKGLPVFSGPEMAVDDGDDRGVWGGDGDDFGEEEARHRAALIILREWRQFRQARALRRLRASWYVRHWVADTAARFRERKRAEEEEEKARSAMQQSTQAAAAAILASGAQNWRAAVATVEQIAATVAHRYSSLLCILNSGGYLGRDNQCVVCPPPPAAPSPPMVPSSVMAVPTTTLRVDAPSFQRHVDTGVHFAGVTCFYEHCTWWQEQAAPLAAQTLRLESAAAFVATRLPAFQVSAEWCRENLAFQRSELLAVLARVEAARDWGWHVGQQARTMIESLRGICSQTDGMVQQVDAQMGAVAAAVAARAAIGQGMPKGAADAAAPHQSLLDLDEEGDDQFMDAQEYLDGAEEFEEDAGGWKDVPQRKGRRGGRKGGRR